jgi:hypothetical protein
VAPGVTEAYANSPTVISVAWSVDTLSGTAQPTGVVVVTGPATEHLADPGVHVLSEGLEGPLVEGNIPGVPSPAGDEAAGADNALAPQGADLQTPALPAGVLEFAANWQEMGAQALAVADLLALAEQAGPWTWVVGSVLLVGAVEAVRRRRQRQGEQAALAGWSEVIAPSGLA